MKGKKMIKEVFLNKTKMLYTIRTILVLIWN